MAIPSTSVVGNPRRERVQADAYGMGDDVDSASDATSAVSWGAVFAGAVGAAALSLILLMLGTGLGLSSVSPWAQEGISKTAFGVTTIAWVTFTQIVASGWGGYLAGRLRTKWLDAQRDEVYFRDTAHGFLSWAVSSLATAALLTSVIGSITHSGLQAGAAVAGGIASTAAAAESAQSGTSTAPMGYFVDALFRQGVTEGTSAEIIESPDGIEMPRRMPATPASPAPLAEAGRIFMTHLHKGALPAQDVRHVGQLVAQHTGLSQQDAEQRVSETYARAQVSVREAQEAMRQAAEAARKTSAYAALWLFIALLIGAFVASLAATLGGRQRDA
ncbi:hypothetical protein [Aquabacterium sp.]|uniref:hypothetical protein n=1 Tax=Aquabacterium sp. TaxID=1872578 RepID=UPI003BB17EFD